MKRKRFYIVRVNNSAADTHASPYSVADAVSIATTDADDRVEWGIVYSTDAGAARIKQPRVWRKYMEGRTMSAYPKIDSPTHSPRDGERRAAKTHGGDAMTRERKERIEAARVGGRMTAMSKLTEAYADLSCIAGRLEAFGEDSDIEIADIIGIAMSKVDEARMKLRASYVAHATKL